MSLQIKLIALGLCAAFLFASGWRLRGDIEDVKYAKALEEKVEAQNKVIEIERENKRKSDEVDNAHQTAINNYSARYNALLKQLRAKDRAAGVMSGNAKTAAEYNAAASGNGFYGERAEALIGLMYQADLQTQQLIACQEWIKSQQ